MDVTRGSMQDVERFNKELENLLKDRHARIKVVGCGGAGGNTLNRIAHVGIRGAQTIAVNTDAQDLLFTQADVKILLGRNVTHGLGAGSNPKLGLQAARESSEEIRKAVKGADLVFVTAGLGGGTGTGSAPIVAQIAREEGALVVAIVTLPFSMEGHQRWANAVEGLERLQHVADTLIVIPNDKLMEIAPDLPIPVAFKLADEILTNAVKGITELITTEGLINLDFADVRTVMQKAGAALIGVGEAEGENRAREAVEKAVHNPLIDADISNAKGALINIQAGDTLTLAEARQAVGYITEKLNGQATIIWGARITPDLGDRMKVMIIVTGVKSLQVQEREEDVELENLEPDVKPLSRLGIDMIE